MELTDTLLTEIERDARNRSVGGGLHVLVHVDRVSALVAAARERDRWQALADSYATTIRAMAEGEGDLRPQLIAAWNERAALRARLARIEALLGDLLKAQDELDMAEGKDATLAAREAYWKADHAARAALEAALEETS